MDLERQHIIIRQRTFVELADLSLHVARRHAGPLAAALAIGAAPFVIFSWVILGSYLVFSDNLWRDEFSDTLTYMFWMGVLVAWQAPIATSIMTIYLGRWTFTGETRLSGWARPVAETLFETFPQMLLYQGILRPFFPFHAFLPEIILLERTPSKPKQKDGLTTMRRNRSLHMGEKANIAGYRVATMFMAGLFFLLWIGCFNQGYALITGGGYPPLWVTAGVSVPIMWICAGWCAILRFLTYMNIRVRHEGWDVELAMRIERRKLQGPTID